MNKPIVIEGTLAYSQMEEFFRLLERFENERRGPETVGQLAIKRMVANSGYPPSVTVALRINDPVGFCTKHEELHSAFLDLFFSGDPFPVSR